MDRRLAAKPDDAEALIHRGWLFGLKQKWPEAIADLGQGLNLQPGDSEAWWLLGDAYLESNKPAAALAAFGRLLKQTPGDLEARFRHGLIALSLHQPNLAREDFSRILAVRRNGFRPRYRHTQALIELGRHREALAELEILIAKYPRDFRLYNLRCTVRGALGDHELARADLEKASSMMPTDPITLNNQASFFATGPIALRDPEQAIALARRGVALHPDRAYPLHTLGVALLARVGTPRQSQLWTKVSPRGKAKPTYSSCSSWQWPTKSWVTHPKPEPVSTGPCARGTRPRICNPGTSRT